MPPISKQVLQVWTEGGSHGQPLLEADLPTTKASASPMDFRIQSSGHVSRIDPSRIRTGQGGVQELYHQHAKLHSPSKGF